MTLKDEVDNEYDWIRERLRSIIADGEWHRRVDLISAIGYYFPAAHCWQKGKCSSQSNDRWSDEQITDFGRRLLTQALLDGLRFSARSGFPWRGYQIESRISDGLAEYRANEEKSERLVTRRN